MLSRSVSIVLFTLFFALASCDSGSEAVGDALEIQPNGSFTLEGGGWHVTDDGDTIVSYATDMSFTFSTARSEEEILHFSGLEIGAMVDGRFVTEAAFVVADPQNADLIKRDLILGGNIKKQTVTFDEIIVGRPKNASWHYPYAWRVRYNDGVRDVERIGIFAGSEQSNRWKGIDVTMETSPDPVGVLDGPNVGDWASSDPLLTAYPAYPNPVPFGAFEVSFGLQSKVDSVTVDYMQRPGQPTRADFMLSPSPGVWHVQVATNDLPKGLGRVRIRAHSGTKMAEAVGDVYIQ
jgi:hypothetical protein